jgi:guanine nucleotide exchange factor for Rho/Rac/Cdc42-like GTPase family protein
VHNTAVPLVDPHDDMQRTVVPQLASDLFTIKGYLVKLSGRSILPKWQRRFFVLVARKVFYYFSEDAYGNGDQPRGTIDLTDFKVWIQFHRSHRLSSHV